MWVEATALLVALAVTVAMAGDETAGTPAWIGRTLEALETHLARHSESEAADVYKLLHQAVMGPGHAIPDRDHAARWLDDEIAALGASASDEPLCEPLGGEPAMVRIHLRPFVAAGGDRGRLLEAFVATADEVAPDPPRFALLARAASARLASGGRSELAEGLRRLSEELEPQGFPAVHHSERFTAAFAPAYRVIALEHARREGWCD